MRPALRLLQPAAASARLALRRSVAAPLLPSSSRPLLPTPRFFATATHAGATFDAAVNELPYADFLRVPDSDVLLDARHSKRQVGAAMLPLRMMPWCCVMMCVFF